MCVVSVSVGVCLTHRGYLARLSIQSCSAHQPEKEKEWEISAVLDDNIDANGTPVEYLVRWKNWAPAWDQWVPAEHVKAKELIAVSMMPNAAPVHCSNN